MSELRTRVRAADPTRRLGLGHRLLARFGTIGLASYVVDVGCYNLLVLLGVEPVTAKVGAVAIATAVSFAANRSWAFEDRARRSIATSAAAFAAVNIVALGISLLCLVISYYALALTSPLSQNISTNVVGVALGTAVRFWAYHRWVFPRSD